MKLFKNVFISWSGVELLINNFWRSISLQSIIQSKITKVSQLIITLAFQIYPSSEHPKSPKICPAPTIAQSRCFYQASSNSKIPFERVTSKRLPQTQFRADCLKLVPALTLAGVVDFPAYLAAPLAAPLYREFDIKESLSSPPALGLGSHSSLGPSGRKYTVKSNREATFETELISA